MADTMVMNLTGSTNDQSKITSQEQPERENMDLEQKGEGEGEGDGEGEDAGDREGDGAPLVNERPQLMLEASRRVKRASQYVRKDPQGARVDPKGVRAGGRRAGGRFQPQPVTRRMTEVKLERSRRVAKRAPQVGKLVHRSHHVWGYTTKYCDSQA